MVSLLLLVLSPASAAPVFSVERGWYDAPFALTLTAESGGALLYSVDESAPSVPYTGPIPIDATTVVRAVERTGDGAEAVVSTHTYLFLDDVLSDANLDEAILTHPTYGPTVEDTLRAIPTISMVVAGGISQTERGVSLEWMDPEGATSQIDCGARIVGGHSLVYEKNSVRITFRDDYGPGQWAIDLYGEEATGVAPADSFDALTLRGGNHDSVFYLGARGQYLRNLWMDETQLEMGHLAPHGRFAHLFLNGAYRGLYHVRERFNAAYMASYLGGDEEDYEAVNGGSAFDGSGAAWGSLVAASRDYTAALPWIDLPNFLDYMVLNFYAGNAWDWSPDHNWIAAGPTRAGEGGFRFHSSDSDICLYYDPTVNVLTNPGPSSVFGNLLAQGHPDFRVALADAIYRNLEGTGPLTPEAARARYARLAALAYDPVVAESARWGQGWWDRDGEWVTERDQLLDEWFPRRTGELLRQVRAAGWYPLGAPSVTPGDGLVPSGTELRYAPPEGAEVWISLDGSDPRQPGGAVTAGALGPAAGVVPLTRSVYTRARSRVGDTWGPVVAGFYEVDAPPAVVLNEWNAVAPDEVLTEGDAALGTLPGNGGDWIELLVLEDVDLRGWRVTLTDRGGDAGTIELTDAAVLGSMRAGTILTIAEDLPEDAAYDPDAGDWRLHLRATADGAVARSTGFDVSHVDWALTLWDPDGYVRFGPVGEGLSPRAGLGSDEVGQLAADPSPSLRRDSPDYRDADASTFGAPNRWGDREQDLSGLRGGVTVGGVVDRADPPAPEAAEPSSPDTPDPGGCSGTGAAPSLAAALAGLLALRRRRALLGLVLFASACGGPADPGDTAADSAPDSGGDTGAAPLDCWADLDADGWGDDLAEPVQCRGGAVAVGGDCDDAAPDRHPEAPETCDGVDDDCDGTIDEDPIDGLPFYVDADGDGFGDEDQLVSACVFGDGATLLAGDCDDADPSRYPGAPENCDPVDYDCDGVTGDVPGASSACPAETCRAILEGRPEAEDGVWWIARPDGAASVWCDMTNGGWTLGFLRNSVSTGSQGDFGAGDVDPSGLGVDPAEASRASTPSLAWIDLNELPWDDLRLVDYANGAATYTSRDIPRSALRIAFGEDGYFLYGGETGYYWCGGDATFTDAGQGSTNPPGGAPADCKGHGSLGSGWDFSESMSGNLGMTLCGGDGYAALTATWGGTWVFYGSTGGAQAIWVR